MMEYKVAYNLVATSADTSSSIRVRPIWPVEKDQLENWLRTKPAHFAAWLQSQDFKAENGNFLVIPDTDGSVAGVVLGLGDNGAHTSDPWTWAKLAEGLPPATYQIDVSLDADAARHAVLGWALASYRFTRYKEADTENRAQLVSPAICDMTEIERIARATFLVRDLVNTPTGDLGPAELEAAARTVAERHKASINCIIGEALLKHRLHAIHTVGRASSEAPRLIDMSWGRDGAPALVLVGKGVCFDSGGLDIKPSSGMRLMKKDMGGAAHVLGLADMIMSAGLDVRLRVLVPAVENAISGNAFRPGDIIRTHKGLSVEVGNTDAEGRLILCDALSLADQETPDLMIDFATLTGAARVALGPDIPPFFTDDHALAADLARLSINEADPVWRLPLWAPYADGLKSTIADLNNISDSPFGGAITAALYLKKFVTSARSWAHFDVYAWNASSRPGRPAGGEAMAMRTVFSLLSERYGVGKGRSGT